MAKKSEGFNLAQTIRDYRQAHRGVSAKDAFDGIKKAHPGEKIKEGTFKSTFYKLAGSGTKKVVKRRRPGKVVDGNGSAKHVLKAGLQFIQLAGGIHAAKEQLSGLQELIEAAKNME